MNLLLFINVPNVPLMSSEHKHTFYLSQVDKFKKITGKKNVLQIILTTKFQNWFKVFLNWLQGASDFWQNGLNLSFTHGTLIRWYIKTPCARTSENLCE